MRCRSSKTNRKMDGMEETNFSVVSDVTDDRRRGKGLRGRDDYEDG
jgi:hypothetical protein